MRMIASERVDMDTVLLICFILSHVCFVVWSFLIKLVFLFSHRCVLLSFLGQHGSQRSVAA